MKRITDPSFKYTPSFETDLRKRFRKMEQERRAAETRKAEQDALNAAEANTKTITLKARKA